MTSVRSQWQVLSRQKGRISSPFWLTLSWQKRLAQTCKVQSGQEPTDFQRGWTDQLSIPGKAVYKDISRDCLKIYFLHCRVTPLGLLSSCHIPVWAEKICTLGMFTMRFKRRGAAAASSTNTESILRAETWLGVRQVARYPPSCPICYSVETHSIGVDNLDLFC